MSAVTLAPSEDKATAEQLLVGAPVKVFKTDGTSVDVPEEAGKTAQFYLDAAGFTVSESDVVYLDGRPVTPDTTVPVGTATHVITVSSEIACG